MLKTIKEIADYIGEGYTLGVSIEYEGVRVAIGDNNTGQTFYCDVDHCDGENEIQGYIDAIKEQMIKEPH